MHLVLEYLRLSLGTRGKSSPDSGDETMLHARAIRDDRFGLVPAVWGRDKLQQAEMGGAPLKAWLILLCLGQQNTYYL